MPILRPVVIIASAASLAAVAGCLMKRCCEKRAHRFSLTAWQEGNRLTITAKNRGNRTLPVFNPFIISIEDDGEAVQLDPLENTQIAWRAPEGRPFIYLAPGEQRTLAATVPYRVLTIMVETESGRRRNYPVWLWPEDHSSE